MELKVRNFAELTKQDLYEILKSRAEVFVVGLKMTCQDIDGIDLKARHYFYEENGRVVAYLRAFSVGEGTVQIGRVLTLHHGKGLGRIFFKDCIAQIKKDFCATKIVLHSQKQVTGFYEKFGFVKVGDEFIEEKVIHIGMELSV